MTKTNTPTTLGYAILGLLKNGPLTGYGIRMIFATSAMGTYSSSPGSIYPALKRLRAQGLVTKIVEKEKGKAHFTLSHAGRESLLTWMRQEIQAEDVSKRLPELMLRFAFQDGLLRPPEQIDFMQQMIGQLAKLIAGMEAFYEGSAAQLPLHGRLAFESGLQSYQTHYTWAKYALKEIKTHTKESHEPKQNP